MSQHNCTLCLVDLKLANSIGRSLGQQYTYSFCDLLRDFPLGRRRGRTGWRRGGAVGQQYPRVELKTSSSWALMLSPQMFQTTLRIGLQPPIWTDRESFFESHLKLRGAGDHTVREGGMVGGIITDEELRALFAEGPGPRMG